MRLRLAKFLAYRAADIGGAPLLTGPEDHWQSLTPREHRRWEFVAHEVIEMVWKEESK